MMRKKKEKDESGGKRAYFTKAVVLAALRKQGQLKEEDGSSEELFSATSLRLVPFMLGGAKLRDTTGPILPQLVRLERLDLSGHELQEVAGIESLKLCLRELNLASNGMKSLAWLCKAGMTVLIRLVVSDNAISRIPVEISKLRSLKSLELDYNRISVLQDLNNLHPVQLSRLSIRGNPICEQSHTRLTVINAVGPWLDVLDGSAVDRDQREEAAQRFGSAEDHEREHLRRILVVERETVQAERRAMGDLRREAALTVSDADEARHLAHKQSLLLQEANADLRGTESALRRTEKELASALEELASVKTELAFMKIDTSLAKSPTTAAAAPPRFGGEDSSFRRNNTSHRQQEPLDLDSGDLHPVMVDVGHLGHAIQQEIEEMRQTSMVGLCTLAESVTKLDNLTTSLQREATNHSDSGIVGIPDNYDSVDVVMSAVEATLTAREELAGLHGRFVAIDDRTKEMAKAAVHNDEAIRCLISECMDVQSQLEHTRAQALEDKRQFSETQQLLCDTREELSVSENKLVELEDANQAQGKVVEAACRDARERINHLNASEEKARSLLNHAEKELEEVKVEADALRNKLRTEAEDGGRRVAAVKGEVKQWEAALETLQLMMARERDKLDAFGKGFQDAKKEAEEETIRLQGSVRDWQAKLDKLQDQYHMDSEDIAKQKGCAVTELETLEKDVNRASTERRKAVEQLNCLRQEETGLCTTLQRRIADVARAEESLANLTLQEEELENELSKRRRDAALIEEQVMSAARTKQEELHKWETNTAKLRKEAEGLKSLHCEVEISLQALRSDTELELQRRNDALSASEDSRAEIQRLQAALEHHETCERDAFEKANTMKNEADAEDVRLSKLKNDVSKAEKDLNELCLKISSHKSELETIRGEEEVARFKQAEMHTEVEKIRSREMEARATCLVEEGRLADLRKRLAETVQERDRAQSSVKQSEIGASETKRAVSMARIELEELKRAADAERVAASMARDEAGALMTEAQRSRLAITSAENQLAGLRAELSCQREDLARQRSQVQILEARAEDETYRASESSRTRQSLESELQALRSEASAVRSSLGVDQERLSRLRGERQALLDDISALQRSCKARRADAEEAATDRDQMKEAAAALSKSLALERQALVEVEAQRAKLDRDLNSLKKEATDLGPGAEGLINGMENLKLRLEHGHKELDRVEKRRRRALSELGELSSMRDWTLVRGAGGSTTTRDEVPSHAMPGARGGHSTAMHRDSGDGDFFRPSLPPPWSEEELNTTRYEYKGDLFERTDAVKSARILELERKLHELVDTV